MIRNAERLVRGDVREMDHRVWEVEAAEIQHGMVQVLWRCGEDRRWDEYAPGTPVIVADPEPAAQARRRMISTAAALAPGDQRVGPDSPPFRVVGTEPFEGRVVVEWSNGVATRVREYDPFDGILVERPTAPGS
ncbi:MAG TPA: hypothetical protein VF665_16255 [Longimicrobium sp.]|jgi:hypothetical protein|uniref:hypothetical protein n=1 Tax=Longimicrobium sp. TaxID=2029185 RepID=UPI002EDACB01